MYAFDESLQSAWQALFNAFRERVTERFALKKTLRFDTDETTLRDRDLLIGQTCGYPLIRFYKDNLVPLCAPVFDVPGCDDIFYRSAVIVAADSGFRSLPDCAGTAVAINGTDSNSGMNLLRDAVRGCANTNPFFASTIVTGSHLGSIAAVAEHRVDVAAIDCVTLALARQSHRQPTDAVKVIGYTDKSAGLPFVAPGENFNLSDAPYVVNALNASLTTLSPQLRSTLSIIEFKGVTLQDYQSIEAMEQSAVLAHHSPLHL